MSANHVIADCDSRRDTVGIKASALIAAVFPQGASLISVDFQNEGWCTWFHNLIRGSRAQAEAEAKKTLFRQFILPSTLLVTHDESFVYDQKQIVRDALRVEKFINEASANPLEYRFQARVWHDLNQQLVSAAEGSSAVLNQRVDPASDSQVARRIALDLAACISEKAAAYQQVLDIDAQNNPETGLAAFLMFRSACCDFVRSLSNVIQNYELNAPDVLSHIKWFEDCLNIAREQQDDPQVRADLVLNSRTLIDVARKAAEALGAKSTTLESDYESGRVPVVASQRADSVQDQVLRMQLIAQ